MFAQKHILLFHLHTSQNIAPYRGGGESQTRYLERVPSAHVVEHGVHSLHAPQPPRSESILQRELAGKKIILNRIHILF